MRRRFDHIDLRVSDLSAVRSFYRRLLEAMGFKQDPTIEGWDEYFLGGSDPSEFFGITESPGHVPNETRIAFWADSIEELNALAALLPEIGARNIEGPAFEYGPTYYGVFFEDPLGTRLEICHRTSNVAV